MAENNRPVDVLRDGNLKASIFRNEGEKGAFYSTTFARTYTDERGNLQDSHVFTGTDVLRISELGRQAYSKVRGLEKEEKRSKDLFTEADKRGGRTSQEFERQQTGNGRRRYRNEPSRG